MAGRWVRILPEVLRPKEGSGPLTGQYAFQSALRNARLPWLKIGGELGRSDILWLTCGSYAFAAPGRAEALIGAAEHLRKPYIIGPAVIFHNSRIPRSTPFENMICGSEVCALHVTQSEWYADLIRANLDHQVPIVILPHPVYPPIDGPGPIAHDALILVKYRKFESLADTLHRIFPRAAILRNGSYRRATLLGLARCAACCIYLSDDDRGPVAVEEMLTCGCPIVGVARGAPFVQSGVDGVIVDDLSVENCIRAAAICQGLDRNAIRERAIARFSQQRAVENVKTLVYPHIAPLLT